MLKRAGVSVLNQVGGVRTYAIVAIGLYMAFFTLERLNLFGGPIIGIGNTTFVLLIAIAITLLAFPNVVKQRYAVLMAIVATVYFAIELLTESNLSLAYHVLNLGVLTIGLAAMRTLGKAVLDHEEDVEKLVMDTDNVQLLPYYVGERRVNQELFRLQRVGRPLSIVYCSVIDEDSYPYDLEPINDATLGRHLDAMYKRRRNQVKLARAVLSLAYKSDIVIQHGDALMVCLTEAGPLEAQRFIERLSIFMQSSINSSLLVGGAVFPDNGTSFDQLVHIARGNMRVLIKGVSDTASRRRRGDVLVDIDQRLEIEKKSQWLNALAYQSPSAKAIYRPIKRLMDIAICLVFMPLLLPVCLVVALAIYMDDGAPIIYKQDRTGFGGKRFRMYKFRTMYVNAPALQPNKIIGEDGQEVFAWPDKDEDDPRITRVGRFLRKTSLDELPQLFNVLWGDMSIVGPRPTTWDVSMYTLHQTERLTVSPGITGLWQISARESKNPDERLLWDLKYVEKVGFWLDIQIMWRTVMQVIKKGGV